MAGILCVEYQARRVARFTPVLERTPLRRKPTELLVFGFSEAACQHSRLSQAGPDLALLDADMHGNDQAGSSVSRALQRKWPDLPSLYLSEHSGTSVEQQAFETTGAVDFIAKHQRNIESVLCWRIGAALRQRALSQPGIQTAGDVLQSGDLSLDRVTWDVDRKSVV